MRFSVITPWFIESIWALITVLDLWEWDEIVCSPFADYALYDALEKAWVTVKIHDCQKETGQVLPEDITRYVTQHTKLVIVTHHRWNIIDIPSIRQVIHKHTLIIEDCSYAHGASISIDNTKQMVWTLWDVALFWLQYEKLIYTGQWAILVTNNRLIVDCVKQLFINSYQAIHAPQGSVFSQKYYLSPLHAILWKYALRKYTYTRQGSDKCLAYFRERLSIVSYLSFVAWSNEWYTQSSWYGFVLQYNQKHLRKLPLSWLITLLASEWVEVRCADDSIIECLSDKGQLQDHNAYDISKSLLYLPSFYDRYDHKDVIDQYIAAFRKIQLNLFC